MDVLMVLWDGGGNVPTQLAIARALLERGHRVRVLSYGTVEDRATRAGAEFVRFTHAPDPDPTKPETDLVRDWEARTPLGEFARLQDRLVFGPASAFARDVADEVHRVPADVVAFDYLLFGAGIAAEAARVPSVALIHMVFPLAREGVPPFGLGLRPARGPLGRLRDRALARAFELAWRPTLRRANAARAELGLEPLRHYAEQLERAQLGLVMTSPEFDLEDRAALPPGFGFVGPIFETDRAAAWEPPWDDADPRPLVLASFSTSYMDQRDLARRTLQALGELPVRGLLTTGPALDVSGVRIPGNVIVRDFVPHSAVLPRARLVVTHAGIGTVHAALAHAVPLICLPSGRDQPENAARVVECGAGVRLPRRASAGRLRRAIAAALDDRGLTEGASRMAAALDGEDGAARAAEAIEALADA